MKKKNQVTELGKREGCTVKAITDGTGSHVVVCGETIHGLHLCKSHKQAVAFGKRVVKEGFAICKWEKPFNDIHEYATAIVNAGTLK